MFTSDPAGPSQLTSAVSGNLFMCGQATAEAVAPVGGTYTSKSGNKGPLINSARGAVNGSALHMDISRRGHLAAD